MEIKGLRGFFRKHPYSTNVLFSFVMVGLEKAAEYEFECPCTKGFAWAFFWFYLLLPMFISVVFGLYLLSCQCKRSPKNYRKFLSSTVPSVVWLALFFSNGRYVACLQTAMELTAENTNGTERVTDRKNPYWLFCDRNQTLAKDQPDVRRTFYISKLCGFSVFLLISIVALCYKCCKRHYKGCCKFLGDSDEVPCCSAHGRTCGSSHCQTCCSKHRRTCCSEHKSVSCLAHPDKKETQSKKKQSNESEEMEMDKPDEFSCLVSSNTGAAPCAKTNTCTCLCHQTCDCECHKP